MKKFNIIIVFSPDRKSVLMCRRRKPPYKGLLNFIGGHIEPGETHEAAAYRELCEETSITQNDIELIHIMDLSYPLEDDSLCEVWCGTLKHSVTVAGEENPLFWIDSDSDFSDITRFSGVGNIYHMIMYIKANVFTDEKVLGE